MEKKKKKKGGLGGPRQQDTVRGSSLNELEKKSWVRKIRPQQYSPAISGFFFCLSACVCVCGDML